jgi:hypothetical protein
MTEHRTVADRDGFLVCSCGHREQTVWGMAIHRRQAAGELPEEDPDDHLDHPA